MSEMPLSIGAMVENYRVNGIIGAGGMGTVYKVQHLISDRIEAMKAILPDLLDTSEAVERFRNHHTNDSRMRRSFRMICDPSAL